MHCFLRSFSANYSLSCRYRAISSNQSVISLKLRNHNLRRCHNFLIFRYGDLGTNFHCYSVLIAGRLEKLIDLTFTASIVTQASPCNNQHYIIIMSTVFRSKVQKLYAIFTKVTFFCAKEVKVFTIITYDYCHRLH